MDNTNISAVVALMPSPSHRTYNLYTEEKKKKWRESGSKHSVRDIKENRNNTIEFDVPTSFLEDALKYDANEIVSKIKQPKLFIAADNDPYIMPSEIETLFNNSPKPKDYIFLRNSDHDYRFSPEKVQEVDNLVIKFIKNQNL